MAVELSEDDYDLLDRYLDTVLERHANGKADLATSRIELVHLITMITNETPSFRGHMAHIITGVNDAPGITGHDG
jgi:hypothetical protein